jgi:hypothetical protein
VGNGKLTETLTFSQEAIDRNLKMRYEQAPFVKT